MDRISVLNQQDTAEYGVNKFSDLSQEEFAAMYLTYKPTPIPDDVRVPPVSQERVSQLPKSFDWRNEHPSPVTPVKNQKQCGSCWAFSATENIESVWIRAGHSAVELAPQQIVDCDTTDDGCQGGFPSRAFEYVIRAGGMEKESDYPYTARNGRCEAQKDKMVVKISSFKYATQSRNETEMQVRLQDWAPLSICLDASQWSSYRGGVLTHCGNQQDHCVQLVGWNKESNPPYWIVRNSWGEDWGMNGYIHLEMGKNMCGVDNTVTSAFV